MNETMYIACSADYDEHSNYGVFSTERKAAEQCYKVSQTNRQRQFGVVTPEQLASFKSVNDLLNAANLGQISGSYYIETYVIDDNGDY